MSLSENLMKNFFKKQLPLAKAIRKKRGMSGRRGNSSDEAYSMIIGILKILHPSIKDFEIEDCITDGRNDGSIDAVFIPKNRRDKIEIMEVKTKGFDYKDVKTFFRDVEDYVFGNSKLDGLNNFTKKKVKRVHKLMRKRKVNIYSCRPFASKIDMKIKKLSQPNYASIGEVILADKEKILERFITDSTDLRDRKWDLSLNKKDLILIPKKNKISIILAKVSIEKLVNLMEEYGEEKINLFEKNVREYQKNKEISTNILNSIKQHPQDFFIFHNGLTIICKDIEEIKQGDYIINTPQIINGCQTMSYIFEDYQNKKISGKDLKKAYILCRIYSLIDKKIIEKVCQSTNTQVKISLDDLRSNDEIQKILEKFFFLNNKKYRRKGRKGFSKVKLGQWIYSCKFKEPADAKNRRSLLFDTISPSGAYTKIFRESINISDLLLILKIGDFVNEKIKSLGKNRTFKKDADLHIMASIFMLKKNGIDFEKAYGKAIKSIKKIISQIRKIKGRDYSYNKIFTKDKETWRLLQKSLLKKK